jgi:hypothetical protein
MYMYRKRVWTSSLASSIRRSPPAVARAQGGAATVVRGGQRARRSGGAHLRRPTREVKWARWPTVACVQVEWWRAPAVACARAARWRARESKSATSARAACVEVLQVWEEACTDGRRRGIGDERDGHQGLSWQRCSPDLSSGLRR